MIVPVADRTITFRLNAVTGGFTQAMQQAGSTVARQGSRMEQSMQRNRRAFDIAGAAAIGMGTAVGFAMKSAGDQAIEFESTITKLSTQIGLTAGEVAELRDAALSMQGTGRGAQELGDAAFFVASAGLRGSEALDAMEQSARASAIGLGDTKEVADLVTSAMNAYGAETLNAEAATDVLLGAVREGKAQAPELAQAMGRVLPVASEMGVSFDQVGAATAAMTRTGTDASTATMQLRQILMGLLTPTVEAEETLSKFGLSAEGIRQRIREDGLISVLELLRDRFGDNEEAMARVFGNARSLSGVLDIVGANGAENAQIFERMTDTAGLAADAFEEWGDTAEAQEARASAAWENARIQFGEATLGIRSSMAGASESVATWLNDLDESTQQTVMMLGGVTSAVGVLGGGFLVLAPRVLEGARAVNQMTAAAGGLRGVMARGLITGIVFDNLARMVSGFNDGRVAASEMIDEIVEGADSVEAALDQVAGSLEEHVESSATFGDTVRQGLELSLGPLFQTIQGLRGESTEMTDSFRDAGVAFSLWNAEAEVTERMAGKAREQAAGLTGAMETLRTPLWDTADALSIVSDATPGLIDGLDDASSSTDEMSDSARDLQSTFGSMGGPIGVFTDLLADKEAAERESAQASAAAAGDSAASWEDFADDVDVSLGEFAAGLEERNENMRDFGDNLVTVAAEFGSDVAMELQAMSDEGVEIAAEMADGSTEEAERLAAALVDNAKVGGDGFVEELDLRMRIAEEVAKEGGENTVAGLAETLEVGTGRIAEIAGRYGIALADGLNPIIRSVGGQTIFIGGGRQQVGRGSSQAMAEGGFLPDQATIQAPTAGLVQWAEPETQGEAFIPLAASKRARSLAIWEETGRRLGADINRLDPHSLHEVGMADGGIRSFADGGFSSLDDVPDVPGLPFSGEVADVGQATMEHARDAAMSWLEKNLAPKLGAGIGWKAMWESLSTQFPSAALHSAYRPGAITATGNPSYHGMGRAIDVSPRGDIAQWIRDNYMAETREMIFSPFNQRQIHNGRDHMYTGITRAMHWDHVHWAMANGGIRSFDDGGILPTGLSLAYNGTGGPETVMSSDQIDDIVEAIERVDGQLQEMAEQEVAERRAARLEGLEGSEREQFLADERRDERRADLEAERADLEDILAVEREIAENRRQRQFDRLDPREQLAAIDDRRDAERMLSDEWMRLTRERNQLAEEIHREAQARDEELRRKAEDAFSALVQLLEERDRVEQRMADRRTRYEQDVAEARSRHAEQVEREIRAREDSLRFDPASRMTLAFGNRPAAIAANVRDQIAAVLDSERLLEDLRGRGLDDSVISALGLDDPAQLRTLEEFARATDEEIAGLNDAIVDRNRTAGQRAERDAGRAYTSLGSTLVGMRGELDRELADLHEAFRADMAEMNVELQEIGQDQGRSFAEAIAEGIESGIPAIRQAARAARDAQRASSSSAADRRREETGSPYPRVRDPLTGRTLEVTGEGEVRLFLDAGWERAHTGGLIAGRGEVPIIAKGGERIVTDQQNRALMDAIERLAGARSDGPLVTVGQQVFEDPVDVEHFSRQIAQLATRVGR